MYNTSFVALLSTIIDDIIKFIDTLDAAVHTTELSAVSTIDSPGYGPDAIQLFADNVSDYRDAWFSIDCKLFHCLTDDELPGLEDSVFRLIDDSRSNERRLRNLERTLGLCATAAIDCPGASVHILRFAADNLRSSRDAASAIMDTLRALIDTKEMEAVK